MTGGPDDEVQTLQDSVRWLTNHPTPEVKQLIGQQLTVVAEHLQLENRCHDISRYMRLQALMT